jgi:tyrosyl-tRNA synthetase
MLTFDSVRMRLERQQPLTFLEFSYMLLQAYDFLELYRRYDCRLQLGGSDQWGNIINGVELTRKVEDAAIFGLTSPLLTISSGAKMGKTASGAIWLNAEMLSAYDYWQFWRNTADADVHCFLKLFTELPLDEIARLAVLKDAELNEAKIILANEATALCHGADAARIALETARQTFAAGEMGDALPAFAVSMRDVKDGLPLFKLMVSAGLAASGAEARKLIKGNGARLNNELISSEVQLISLDDFQNGRAKLSAGKKRHAVLELS